MLDIAIIGGGLSGLNLAKGLLGCDCSFAVFESRERFGGRILSVSPSTKTDPGNDCVKYDLGPSWIWPDFQPRITRFLHENSIEIFSQWTKGKSLYQTDRETPPQAYLDDSPYESARRIQGGTFRLIETLLEQLPDNVLHLHHHLHKVIDRHDFVELHFSVAETELVLTTRRIVITIPPRLLINTLTFSPAIDTKLQAVMDNTATWMGGHAKAVIRYERPFWRESELSGNALARYQGAALAEIFDACSSDGKCAALSGFFALPAGIRRQYPNDLEALILDQLVRLFGQAAARPLEVIIKDWFDEPLTSVAADEFPPAAHPQYGHPWLQLDHWNNKLYFSGTETAQEFGGYLEGALESAERVQILLLM